MLATNRHFIRLSGVARRRHATGTRQVVDACGINMVVVILQHFALSFYFGPFFVGKVVAGD